MHAPVTQNVDMATTTPDRAPAMRHLMRMATRCVLVLLAINALFLAIRFADNLIPRQPVAEALRTGYADGSMSEQSYPNSMLVGRDMYSDCITAQIALLGDPDPVLHALAPRLLTHEQVGADMKPVRQAPCRDLKQYLDGTAQPTGHYTYTRFWHGGATVMAAALAIWPLDGYRSLLLSLTLGLIALAGVLAARAPPGVLPTLSALLVGSFLFCGQFGYGQLVSYGPAQIAQWALVCWMLACPDRLSQDQLVLLAVLSGALEAFFDQLISPPLAATIFVVVAQTIAQSREDRPRLIPAATGMITLFAAWAIGFVGSYVIKLVLTVAVMGWAPVQDMVQQLAFRVGTVDAELGYEAHDKVSRFTLFFDNVWALGLNVWRMGFGSTRSTVAGLLLVNALAVLGWLLAIARTLRPPREDRMARLVAGLPYIGVALFLVLWVLALPEHTVRHAFFMVRSSLIWLIGGWGWLIAVAYMPRQTDGSGGAAEPGRARDSA